jgi:hypothetical protein
VARTTFRELAIWALFPLFIQGINPSPIRLSGDASDKPGAWRICRNVLD